MINEIRNTIQHPEHVITSGRKLGARQAELDFDDIIALEKEPTLASLLNEGKQYGSFLFAEGYRAGYIEKLIDMDEGFNDWLDTLIEDDLEKSNGASS
jgi:hypothetical protein